MTSQMFDNFYSDAKAAVSEYLTNTFARLSAPPLLKEAMSYAALDGGKLLRPTLVLGAALDSGGNRDDALPLAAAAELIHVYSLVHDDLPAMDNDDVRRGKPSCHRQYGEAMAILAGNALMSLAFELALEARPTSQAASAARILAHANGCSGICGGQAIDLGLEGELQGPEDILNCYRLKTGVLFAACASAGAVLVRGDAAPVRAMEQYGWHLGEAFQIYDDLGERAVEPRSLLGVMARSEAYSLAKERMQRARHLLPRAFVRLRELTLYVEEIADKAQT